MQEYIFIHLVKYKALWGELQNRKKKDKLAGVQPAISVAKEKKREVAGVEPGPSAPNEQTNNVFI